MNAPTRVAAYLAGAGLTGLAYIGWLNRASISEGLAYLQQLRHWQPAAVQPLAADGRFAACRELVQLTNTERCRYVAATLTAAGLQVEPIAIPGEEAPNLLVRLGPPGPLTLFVAHYDKSRETPDYQGASDNTAAVSVLLAAAQTLVRQPPDQPTGLLFTAAEERGLRGATAFIAWAAANRQAIRAAINFDMLGRDRLAIRPSALPGFYVALPGGAMLVYDGRRIRWGAAYPQPAAALVQQLQALAPADLVVYSRFTAHSDSNVFQAAAIPTVAISSSNIYYLDRVWERAADRVELLDERNLERAYQLVLACCRQ